MNFESHASGGGSGSSAPLGEGPVFSGAASDSGYPVKTPSPMDSGTLQDAAEYLGSEPREQVYDAPGTVEGAGFDGRFGNATPGATERPVGMRRPETPNGGWEEVLPSEDSGPGWVEIVPDDNLKGSGWVEIKGDPNYEEGVEDRKSSDPLDDYLKSLDTTSADGQVAAYLASLDPEAARLWGQLQQEWARIDREQQGQRNEAAQAFQPAISSFTNGFMASQANAFTNGSGFNPGQCGQLAQQIQGYKQWLNQVVPNRSQYGQSGAVDATIHQVRKGLNENLRQFRAGGC